MMNFFGLGTFFTGLVQHFNGERSREHASDIEQERQRVSRDIARLNRESAEGIERDRQRVSQEIARLNRESAEETAHLNRESAEEISRLNRESAERIARENRAQDWRKHEELKTLQRQLVDLNCKAVLQAAEIQRQATLGLPEEQGIMAKWPLHLYPSQILRSHRGSGLVPLRLVPSFLGYGDLELQLDLVKFMQTHYPKSGQLRPVEMLDDTWDEAKPHGSGSIKALFGRLHSEPMLIVRSTRNGNELTCRVAYWGIAAHDSFDEILLHRQSCQAIVLDSAKSRVRIWPQERSKYLEQGLASNEAEADRDYGDANLAWNRDMLAEEEKVRAAGLTPKNQKAYKTDEEDETAFRQVVMTCHKLVAAFFADAHYLVHHNVPPLLPSLLPELTKDIAHLEIVQEAITNIVEGYRGIFEALQGDRAFLIPDLALEVALGLVNYFPAKANSMYDYSLNCWLNLYSKKEVAWEAPELTFDSYVRDEDYVQGLSRYFRSIGETNKSSRLDSLLQMFSLQDLKSSSASMTSALKDNKGRYQLVIGIDFGTSRSGFAYGWMNEQTPGQREIYLHTKWPSQPSEVEYVKTPTLLLYSPGKEEIYWGYEAKETLMRLSDKNSGKDYHLFEGFKMKLYERSQYYESGGQRFLVLDLISDYLRKLKDYALSRIFEGIGNTIVPPDKILWCLTIPAMWDNQSKDIMVDAAVKAGLINQKADYGERLVFVLEPEAAALYCQYKFVINPVPQLEIGTRFMVVDAGGGTVDITVHEVSSEGLKALAKSIGDAHGSTYVDRDFQRHLEQLLSPEIVRKLEKENPVGYVSLINQWEQKKCAFDDAQVQRKTASRIPIPRGISKNWSDQVFDNLAEKQDGDSDNIVLSLNVMERIFKSTLDKLILTVDREFSDLDKRGKKCDYLFLVGGFAHSPLLQKRIRERYEGIKVQKVIIPHKPGSAILWGAVSYGIDPSVIRSRSSRLTYGISARMPYTSLGYYR